MQLQPITRELVSGDAVAVIITFRDSVLLQHRDNKKGIFYPDHWGLFGGAIEQGEMPEETAVREISEEISVDITPNYWNTLSFNRKFGTLGKSQAINETPVLRHYFTSTINDFERRNITLNEGQGFGLYKYCELNNLKICPYDKFMLDWYYAS